LNLAILQISALQRTLYLAIMILHPHSPVVDGSSQGFHLKPNKEQKQFSENTKNEGTNNSGSENRNFTEEEYTLEEIYDDVDFDFDLSGVHSDAKNILQSFIKHEVIKSTLSKQLNKVVSLKEVAANKGGVVKESLLKRKKQLAPENLKQALKSKKKQLEQKLQTPPFIRTSDKCAFTIGILVLLITEYIILKKPHHMSYWYTVLLVPLMFARYYFYKKAKYQYFMIDFCYFAQAMLLISIFAVPSSSLWFQVVFTTSNGPLLAGIVMWRNSLVFHDLDKLTSVFIHIFPALVTFCWRWYPHNDHSTVCPEGDCWVAFGALGLALVCYCFWQIAYFVKTEVIDKEFIEKDKEIMTSARWMSDVKPHPIWVMCAKRGCKREQASFVLMTVQLIYTGLTFVPIPFIYHSFELHVLYLAATFLVAVWNGANFYFEIFSETYSKRLQKMLNEAAAARNLEVSEKAATTASTSSSSTSTEKTPSLSPEDDKMHQE